VQAGGVVPGGVGADAILCPIDAEADSVSIEVTLFGPSIHLSTASIRSCELSSCIKLALVLYKIYCRRQRSAHAFAGGGDDVDAYRSVP
jgi:hypothetical protein